MTVDKNCLSYWFPRLRDAGIPVPKTEIIDVGDDWYKMIGMFDSPRQHPESHGFAMALISNLAKLIIDAAEKVGDYPLFLRTGMGSGKHRWKECCDLRRPADIESHICGLIDWSESADMIGLPYRIWCVRERLPVNPIAFLPEYGDMPLVREKRFFIEDGIIVCSHPYWPRNAIRDGLKVELCLPSFDGGNFDEEDREYRADDLFRRASIIDSPGLDEMARLAQQVAMVFRDDGAWSVDVLESSRGPCGGFHVCDMAVASRSFHWEGCEMAARFKA